MFERLRKAIIRSTLRTSRREPRCDAATFDRVLRGLGAALLNGTEADSECSSDAVNFVEIREMDAYRKYRESMASVLAKRVMLEKLLCFEQVPFRYAGFDGCAGRLADFYVDFQYAFPEGDRLAPNYRERVVSSVTGLNSRQRASMLAMDKVLVRVPLERADVYVTEAITPFFRHILKRSPGAIGSEFFGADVPRGSYRNKVRNEDVTALTFPDASFDVVISNDVLEHVPGYLTALGELRRVLKPGGALLLTVPFATDQYEHIVRARVGPLGVEQLMPPEYHGDPVNPGGGSSAFKLSAGAYWTTFEVPGLRIPLHCLSGLMCTGYWAVM